MLRVWAHILVAVLLTALLSACATSHTVDAMRGRTLPAPDTGPASEVFRDTVDYRVGPQDVLDVTVLGVPDLSRTVRVTAGGEISLPLIGTVKAGGMTVPEVERRVAADLAGRYLRNPQVTVFIKEFASQRVTLEGAVRKPGIYPIVGKTTLLQAIALAEGLDPLADLRGVVVFRQINGQRMAAAFDMRDLRTGRGVDPQIYGNDIIVVEQSNSKTALRRFLEVLPAFGIFMAL